MSTIDPRTSSQHDGARREGKDIRRQWKIAFSSRGLAHATTTTAPHEALESPEKNCKASRSSDTDNWDSSEILIGDLAEELAVLKKRQARPLLVHGGAGFARSLLALDY